MLLVWAECRGAFGFIMSSVFMLKVVTPTAVIILTVIMLSTIMLSVIVMNVMAPAVVVRLNAVYAESC